MNFSSQDLQSDSFSSDLNVKTKKHSASPLSDISSIFQGGWGSNCTKAEVTSKHCLNLQLLKKELNYKSIYKCGKENVKVKSSVIITDYVTSSLAFIMFCVSVRNSLIKGCKVLDEISRFDSQPRVVAVCPHTLQ